MNIVNHSVEFTHQNKDLEAKVFYDEDRVGQRSGILVAHAWAGRTEYEEERAAQLAELGYIAFGMDVYGKGVRGNSTEENSALMQPFMEDRALLQSSLAVNLDHFMRHELVEPSKVAAIGFCFGGLAVLDMARMGAELRGVASFHGLLNPPENITLKNGDISAKVLALHGWNDPLAPPENFVNFANEMTDAGADWQALALGNTMHAFTNKKADMPDMGMLYNANADRRAWQLMLNFFEEVFA